MTEKQSQMQASAIERLAVINNNPNEYCAMLAPEFVSCCAEESSLTLRCRVQAWELNPYGIVHGGVVASMLDTVLGVLVNIVCNTLAVTVSLQTSFLRSAQAGDSVIVAGKIVYRGKSIVHCEAKAWCEGNEDELIATATAVFKP